MTRLWSEGFDNQNAAADCLDGVLASITGSFALVTGANFGGKAVALTSTSVGTAAICTKAVANTVQGYTHNNVLLAAVTSGDDYQQWWTFYDATAGAPQITVALDGAAGQFVVYQGWAPYTGNGAASGTLLGTSAAGLVPPSAFTAVEIGLKIDASAGFVTVKVNGIQIAGATVAGVDTKATANAYFNQVWYGCTVSEGIDSYAATFDDFYIGDTTGSYFTGFIGPGAVWTRFATSNGGTVQFTPLTGSNYQEISETAMDSDASYNVSGTIGNIDEFTSNGTIATVWTPLFMVLEQASRADNALGRQAASFVVSGGTFTGASTTKGTIYTYQNDLVTTGSCAPGTITLSAVEASVFGYSVAG